MNKLARLIFLVSVVISIFTRSSGEFTGAASQRFLPADGLALLSGFILIIDKVLSQKSAILVPPILKKAIFLVMFGFIPGLLVSQNPLSTVTEIAVHALLIATCLIAVNLFSNEDGFRQLQFVFICSAVLAALLGMAQLLTGRSFSLLGLQVGGDNLNIAVGTFRNSGQAGTYVYIAFLTAISSMYAEIKREKRNFPKFYFYVGASILLAGYALITGKVAASIGLLISGAALFVMSSLKGNLKLTLVLCFAFVLVGLGFLYVLQDQATLMDYVVFKWTDRLDPSRLESGSFLYKNFTGAIRAFRENMLFGSGLGAFGDLNERYEVHSTYLKMLGEAGLLGVLFYFNFIFSIFKSMWKCASDRAYHSAFLLSMMVVLVGGMVSWSYSYHMRKREFWTTVALIVIAVRITEDRALTQAEARRRALGKPGA